METDRILNLGRLEDLDAGSMRLIEVQGHKILLVRQGEKVTAIGAECPHAGGPLVEGVLADGKIICPWHKASFCASSGVRLDPPAVDNLESYAIEIQNGDIVLRDAENPPAPKPLAAEDKRRFVILGAGAAGFSAAQELRNAGFAGAITLISHEDDLPYDRTILSKSFLSGGEGGEKSPLQGEDFFDANKIERVKGEISGIDGEEKSILLSDGRKMPYDAALIATGGAVIAPDFPGSDLENVFTLRSRSDAARILGKAEGSRRAVVIGASFIGMEAAAALTERGLEVTVIGTESAPFEHQLGAVLGNVYREIHEQKSVKFRLGAKVDRIEGDRAVQAVILKDGEKLLADLVVAGLGVRPATGFVQALTRKSDQAIEVDSHLRLAKDLYAAGDVAAFPIYGRGRLIRVEHWRVAEQQGMIAARNMAGGDACFTSVPYFWTIQYMIRLDYVGHASGADELVVRGDLGARDFIAYYLQDGVVAAAAGMNRDKDMAAVIALMNRRQNWTLDELHPRNASPAKILLTKA
jgi:NADPH-dependent 2,4-dienoyl-CoA reductase/sulfur reductase-like enzyme/nitrite reductase/ring-hydroxylating ferredoxin subunit